MSDMFMIDSSHDKLRLKESEEMMSDIINIKDFYNHETRISIVENALIHIDKRFDYVDQRFEQVDKRFEQLIDQMNKRFEQNEKKIEKIDDRMNSQFKWIMSAMGGLALTTISILVTIIYKLH